MNYRGDQSSVMFDESVNTFRGRVVNIRYGINFQVTSVDELTAAFHEAIDDYLEFCAERGETPDKPFR